MLGLLPINRNFDFMDSFDFPLFFRNWLLVHVKEFCLVDVDFKSGDIMDW